MTQHVQILPPSLDELSREIGEDRHAELMASREGTREELAGREIVHVDSTSTGGGVTEILPTQRKLVQVK